MSKRTFWGIVIAISAFTVIMLVAYAGACEPVKIKPTIEFCDVWFWGPVTTGDLAFKSRDTIYVTNDSGRVCGVGRVVSAFPMIGAMIHVYGDEWMTPIKDGPRTGDTLLLRWSRLPACGLLPTREPIIYKHWSSVYVVPVLPGD